MMTTAQEFERRRWIALGAALLRAVHRRARRLDRQRGAAVDRQGARLLTAEPAVGRECVRAHLRRLPAARRKARGPDGSTAGVHRRAPARRGGLARGRILGQRGAADRRARGSGPGAAIISPAALSIVTTTFQDGAERNKALGAWGAVAGAGGAAGVLLGGNSHRGTRLGVGALGQRARGADRRRAVAAADRREPLRVGHPPLRRGRRGERHRRPLGAGLRDRRRDRRGLGLARRPSACWASPRR